MHKLEMLLEQVWKITLKEVLYMTLNILFFSITIKKREVNLEKIAQQEMVDKLYDQNKDRQISMHHFM